MITANRLLYSKCLLNRLSSLVQKQSRATYIKGYWPEPFTQQTLEQFLADIDYFEQPKQFVDIGLKLEEAHESTPTKNETDQLKINSESSASEIDLSSPDVGRLLDMLGEDIALPSLDHDDAALNQTQLKNLAISQGIYRDLFHEYKPKREHIKFTPDQAERMSKLVPHHWITDQPFARVDRHLKQTDPLHYFEPIVGISARFIHETNSDLETCYAHTVYHGNIIPASEALVKPSISLYDHNKTFQNGNIGDSISESIFSNWTPGKVFCENFDVTAYYTLIMLNLDSIHQGCSNLHWMLTNISHSNEKGLTDFEEIAEYLPVHGIRGFGHSRYVFLLLRHADKLDSRKFKISDFSPKARRFEVGKFIRTNASVSMVPVGLSWFQTTWDSSSNNVFHDYMNMSAPVYELVQEKLHKKDLSDKAYPGKIPFNIFMDHYRDTKENNERVLLERLKNVDPFDYKDQYVPPRVPSTVFTSEDMPSWMRSVMFKKNNKIGYWRGLRPASITIPLNNNADLDYPLRPLRSSKKVPPAYPNLYPAKPRMKLLKDLPYSKPINEHPNVYVQEDHDVHLKSVHKLMKDLGKEDSKT